jgi:hypothetical protein
VTERQRELRNAQQCRVQNREHRDEERRERLRGEERLDHRGEERQERRRDERLKFRVHRVQQPDAWAAGQRQPAERLVQQGAWESGLQAAALIRAARSWATVSAVARKQVPLARPEPGRERQAQQPDEPAPAREQRVSEQRERPASQQQEQPERP